MWIVMHSRDGRKGGGVLGHFRRLAVVKLTDEYVAQGLRPKFIGKRARGIAELQVVGSFFRGKTDESAFVPALASAQALVRQRNEALRP